MMVRKKHPKKYNVAWRRWVEEKEFKAIIEHCGGNLMEVSRQTGKSYRAVLYDVAAFELQSFVEECRKKRK